MITINNIQLDLKKIRAGLCLTQLDFADKCDISVRTIVRIEKGDYSPGAKTKRKIKKFLQI